MLEGYADRPDVVVLGLPRGGVIVAAEVARALHAPLDVLVVRKLGVPGFEELAMGAIASGGVRVLDQAIVASLGVTRAEVDNVVLEESVELGRRERVFRGDRAPIPVAGMTCVIVDDGLATGATMQAAVLALRARKPAKIIVAAPVGSAQACSALRRAADDCICAIIPVDFYALGAWYDDFSQTTDAEVRQALAELAVVAPSGAA
jgi:predicted phosphoribosyltransferase